MISSLVIIFSALAVLSALMCSLSAKIIRTTFFFGVTLFLISFVLIAEITMLVAGVQNEN